MLRIAFDQVNLINSSTLYRRTSISARNRTGIRTNSACGRWSKLHDPDLIAFGRQGNLAIAQAQRIFAKSLMPPTYQ